MERSKRRKIIALMISMLFVFSLCFAAFAEESAMENETDPEEEDLYNPFSEEIIEHRLWGFFTSWAEEDTEWLMGICAPEWKKGKDNPRQALEKLMKSVRPRGYKVESISGEDSDLTRTAVLILQREKEDGGYNYTRHEIACLRDAEGFLFDPEGLVSGSPAESVPEEELVLLTPEGIIRNSIGLHNGEGLYDRLLPVNAVAEKQGIRVEVISGLVEGTNAWFFISLQDTEGKYDGYNPEPLFADNIDNASYSRGWSQPYYDKENRIYYYFMSQELERPVTQEEGTVSVGVDSIRLNRDYSVDLLPLLEQYGGTEEGVTPPKLEEHGYRENAPETPANIRVLDFGNPLDISLSGDVCLTGIGWIGDQLHVQFHNKGRNFLEMNNGRASACTVWVDHTVYGKTYDETHPGYDPLEWDGNDDGWTEWFEYLINCKPEETEQLEISAEISITEEILTDDWIVQIPLEKICSASDD